MNSSPTVTGGQLVVDTLRALGVDRVFGVPGGQTLAIMDAIFDSPDIEFTATRHEGAAACMADAVGRLTRQPGVCSCPSPWRRYAGSGCRCTVSLLKMKLPRL